MLKAQASLAGHGPRQWNGPGPLPNTQAPDVGAAGEPQESYSGVREGAEEGEEEGGAPMRGDDRRRRQVQASSEAGGARLRLPPDAPKTRVQAKVVTNQSLPYTV